VTIPPSVHSLRPPVTSAQWWASRMAVATVAGLAGVVGTLSYSHMRQLAQAHGQADWHVHAFPLSVDGVEIVSVRLAALDRPGCRHGGQSRRQHRHRPPDPVSRVIAGWPALARREDMVTREEVRCEMSHLVKLFAAIVGAITSIAPPQGLASKKSAESATRRI
jgi:hypothetical protein